MKQMISRSSSLYCSSVHVEKFKLQSILVFTLLSVEYTVGLGAGQTLVSFIISI